MRRRAAEWTALTLVGAALGSGLGWLVTSGRASADIVGVLLLAVGVPLLAGGIWLYVRLAREPWDEGGEWERDSRASR